MDNILWWNVRGLNAPNKQKEVKLLYSREGIGLAGLVETKIKGSKIEQVANKLFEGWGSMTNLDYHPNERIWLVWRTDYSQIRMVSGMAQAITYEVVYRSLQKIMMLTVVYVFNTKEERRPLWNYLEAVGVNVSQPWIIMGDFNVVLHMDNRIGGNPVSMAEVKEFHECVENCGLLEFPKQRSRYTWNDKHGGSIIFSKIDWVFVNSEWLDSMPDFSTTFLPEMINDHSPMKLSMLNSPNKGRKQFKYCNVWSSHPLFLERVKAG
ncbi:uncharacterized protein LOC142172176 [Nicotiana tabacum]|uniref:Uncharacterized protein LOC142172176 n=1 Tax=Nicotiana tabacum TaxID=4097 RepID=A0AC58T4B9_TOBAC